VIGDVGRRSVLTFPRPVVGLVPSQGQGRSLRPAAWRRHLSGHRSLRFSGAPPAVGALRLLGRPDYLISSTDGIIPVDLKKSRCPVSGPYDSHAAQLLAYCLLVEDALGKPAPCGVFQYAGREVRLDLTPERRQWVTGILAEICGSLACKAAIVHLIRALALMIRANVYLRTICLVPVVRKKGHLCVGQE